MWTKVDYVCASDVEGQQQNVDRSSRWTLGQDCVGNISTTFICLVTNLFMKRKNGENDAPELCAIVKLALWRKPDAPAMKGLKAWVAVALVSAMTKWHATPLALFAGTRPESRSLKKLYVGAEHGIGSEHGHVLMTNLLQKHWGWKPKGKCRG